MTKTFDGETFSVKNSIIVPSCCTFINLYDFEQGLQ